MTRVLRQWWCSAYLWACHRHAVAGWYGVKVPYHREPIPPWVEWVRPAQPWSPCSSRPP